MKRTFATTAALVLLLAACGAQVAESFSETGSALDGDDFAYGGEQAPGDDVARAFDDDKNALNLDVIFTDNRKVIRQVSLSLAADDTRAAYDEIVKVAENAGGFIAEAQVNPSADDAEPRITLTIRVPAAGLTTSLAAIKDVADEVLAESQGAQDVTATFIDLEAQLTNLEALETELRALLEEVRRQPDADPDKLLRVFTEISTTRGQIEQIQGQLNYLNDVVDLSTVTITIDPTAGSVPIVEESWAPIESMRNALRSLVTGLQQITDSTIQFTIGTLPILLIVVGIPGLVLVLIFRAWRRRQQPAATTLLPSPAE